MVAISRVPAFHVGNAQPVLEGRHGALRAIYNTLLVVNACQVGPYNAAQFFGPPGTYQQMQQFPVSVGHSRTLQPCLLNYTYFIIHARKPCPGKILTPHGIQLSMASASTFVQPLSSASMLFQTGPQQQQQQPQPHYPPPPPRAVPTQEYQQTATIRNQVNLKKHTLRLEATADPQVLAITFVFDASASCR